MLNLKGQSLVTQAIGVLIVMIVIGAVAVPISIDAMVTDLNSVTNETQSSTGTLPETITVSNVKDGVSENSETVYVNDTDTSTISELTKDTNYTVISYDNGQFNMTDVPGANTTSDSYLFSYDYKPDGYIDQRTTRLVVDFIPLALGLGVFIGAISLVQ